MLSPCRRARTVVGRSRRGWGSTASAAWAVWRSALAGSATTSSSCTSTSSHGDAATAAHLLTFDSVHGRWPHDVQSTRTSSTSTGARIGYTGAAEPGDGAVGRARGRGRARVLRRVPHARVARAVLRAGRAQGHRRGAGQGRALNVVIGVNDDRYDPERDDILTCASCTTNCLAPVVKVLHEGIGIRHGLITTLHDMTNTQTVVDAPHKDLRRARAASMSLIPTTTGSATAIGLIFPELEGRLNGHRGPRAAAQRVAHRLRLRGRAPDDRRRGQRAPARRGRGPARGHPRLRGAAAGLGRLQGRPALRRSSTRSRPWSSTARR